MRLNGVSIIICTYNGVERLPKTLDSILQLNPGITRELILVDNASTEDIEGFCHNYFSENPLKIKFKLVKENKTGLTHARIAGIMNSRYDYLLFCDDDNSLSPDYLDFGLEIFEKNENVGIVGGRGIARMTINPPVWFEKYQKSYAVGPQRLNSGLIDFSPSHVYGAGSFFRRIPMLEILEAGFYPSLIGRTNTTLLSGDDLEWCWLLQLKGYKIYYEDKLRFYHDLSEQRLNESYYIKLKAGTASGSALLFAYRTFFKNRNLSVSGFKASFKMESLKHRLRYYKNRFLINSKNWENELALAILRSRVQSFRRYPVESLKLYSELKRIFFINNNVQ
ncbi:MAG: glycosyltransferase family 2 protein [Algoriphagus sp.]|uniref:glycosyltransferase family 2 protein n=1 Tax=Algoriphagus sp. TaxID=1872435 RepID=UPI001803A7BC|nr:glycosyltransferase family 2 protein [Algoriphagus sp.]NVJ86812.1 glycosyltransferase family 2 protein [Algoriphagus sp.]